MLYPANKVNKLIIRKDYIKLWDTPKNIEAEERWVQRNVELVKKTKKNKLK